MSEGFEDENKPVELPERYRLLKNELWAWLRKNDLRSDTFWNVTEDGLFRVCFEGEFYDVVWAGGKGPHINQLNREFEEMLKRHSCWYLCMDDTSLVIFEPREEDEESVAAD